MENLGIRTDLESNFLPFRGDGSRFNNFALFTELLGFVLEGKGTDLLLDFVSESVLKSFQIQGLYLLKHLDGETWKVSQSNFAEVQELQLSTSHAISASLESGAIGVASTDGGFLHLENGTFSSESDSYRLLLIPLIDNLVPRSVLVAVIENSHDISPAEIELFAFLQVIISYVAYGSKPLDKSSYDF